MLGFSWPAFLVYLFAVSFLTLGGLWGLFASENPVFLAPVLMGLFFFYLCWEAVVGRTVDSRAPRKRK